MYTKRKGKYIISEAEGYLNHFGFSFVLDTHFCPGIASIHGLTFLTSWKKKVRGRVRWEKQRKRKDKDKRCRPRREGRGEKRVPLRMSKGEKRETESETEKT